MKRSTVAILLVLVLIFGFSACGSDNDSSDEEKLPSGSVGLEEDSSVSGNDGLQSDYPPEIREIFEYASSETAEQSGVCGENIAWYYLDHTLVVKYLGEDREGYIYINDYARCNQIAENPWKESLYQEITKLIIDDRITNIGNDAFSGLTSLQEVYLPRQLDSIGSKAFFDCRQLEEIEIPEGFRNEGVNIKYWAFGNCKSLKKVLSTENIRSIDKAAFRDCESLVEFEIPDTITCIKDLTFDGCTSLTSLTLPDSVVEIDGSNPFPYNCTIYYSNPDLEWYVAKYSDLCTWVKQ